MAESSSTTDKARALWERWFAVPDDATPAERRAYSVAGIVVTAAWLLHFFYIFLFAYWEVWPLSIANVFSVILWSVCIALFGQRRLSLGLALAVIEIPFHSTMVVIFLGWGFGAQYLLISSSVGIVLVSWWSHRMNVGLVALSAVLFTVLYYYTELNSPLATAPAAQMAVANIASIAFTFGVIAAETAYLISEIEKADQLNEELLHNVLPGPIAARLKQDKSTIADGFQNASILFADLAGFTPVSQALTPEQLVEMLDAIFSRFDDLVDQYGLEKIKTIGDEYMVASGIPIPREDHAEALANFAVAMRASLADYREENDVALEMRIGLNSGPVVAGVIGRRRFLYDLWGDSVNTASRMESHGIPGEIQVSAATRDLLDGKFSFVDRGVIEIKGKGPMQTYLLRANGR